jgi:hypothetical protein
LLQQIFLAFFIGGQLLPAGFHLGEHYSCFLPTLRSLRNHVGLDPQSVKKNLRPLDGRGSGLQVLTKFVDLI